MFGAWLRGRIVKVTHKEAAPRGAKSAHVYCGLTAGWIKIPHITEIGRDPGYIVLDGDPAPPGKGHRSPHFSAHVYCGQRAGWIKIPLSTEVGLGPGDVVLEGTQLPRRRGTATPRRFSVHFALAPLPISAVAEHLLLIPSF